MIYLPHRSSRKGNLMAERIFRRTLLIVVVLLAIFLFLLNSNSQAVGNGETLEARVEALETEVLRLEEQLAMNLFADCLNENILRGALGAEMIDLDACIAEREAWFNQSQVEELPDV